MKVTVRFFGPLVEQTGLSRIEVQVTRATVGDVAAAAAVAAPALRLGPGVRFALNTDYADPAAAVREGDVVSLIPPVGGG
jgi:molybdopterin converting factor small subunit